MSETMPSLSRFKSLKELRTFEEASDHPDVEKRFQEALGKRFDAKQYLAVIRGLVKENDDFRRVDLWELIRCALDLAELQLRPNTPLGHAWLIPREKSKKVDGKWVNYMTIQPQLGYQGILELAYRADTLRSIHADVVFEGDEFDYQYGSKKFLRHKPQGPRQGRKPLHAYSHAELTNGGEEFVVWDWADILFTRDNSDAYKYAVTKGTASQTYLRCPWVMFLVQMAMKTMVLQNLKLLPKSTDFIARAVALDGQAERGELSYAGASGDLQRRQISAEIYVPTDLGRSGPIVDGAMDSTENGAPAETTTAPKQESKKTAAPADTGQHAPARPILYGPDGEVLLTAESMHDWTKEYVEALYQISGRDIEAFRAMNASNLEFAEQDAGCAKLLSGAGEGRQAPKHGNPIAEQQSAPEGRPLDAGSGPQKAFRVDFDASWPAVEILAAFARSLQTMETPVDLTVWHEANKAVIQGLGRAVQMPVLKALAARRGELGPQ